MAEAVIAENEVSLNAVRYRIAGPVVRTLSSVYPGKTVIGDYTKDSSPILSTLALSDHRGGIGLDVMTGDGDTDRSWYSTADPRYKGHLILPPLVTVTGGLPTGLSGTLALMSYQGDVYANVAATTDGIYLYSAAGDTWGANVQNNNNIEYNGRWCIADINNASYLIFGSATGAYVYYNGTSWAERSATGTGGWVAAWRDRVWGVSPASPSRLWYTFTPGSAEVTTLGSTPLIHSIPTSPQCHLFTAKDNSGDEGLYLATSTGLYVYDIDNDRWIATGLQLPDNYYGSALTYVTGVRWRDAIFFASRSSVYKYSLSGNQATISPIGPDRDNGLPSGKGNVIVDMVASLNDLIISTVGTVTNDRSGILAYDGRGWRVLHEASGSKERLSPLLVVSATFLNGGTGAYHLMFANKTTSPFNISYLDLPADLVNPLQMPASAGYDYAAAATHDWPWFTAGQDDVTKVAVRVKVQTTNPTTAETVKVYYAINRSATFQLMTNSTYTTGVITAAGLHTFDFPSVDSWVSTTARTGTAFRSIQFRVVYARGGTTTNTPDVLSLTLEYYKKLDPKWQFQVTLDLNQEYKNNTPKQLRAALLTAQETATLLEFTYRDPAANSDATFYVQVQPVESQEMTGMDERGNLTLQLREV